MKEGPKRVARELHGGPLELNADGDHRNQDERLVFNEGLEGVSRRKGAVRGARYVLNMGEHRHRDGRGPVLPIRGGLLG